MPNGSEQTTVEPGAPAPNLNYDWKARGEEWSAPWGSSAAQWFGSVRPRIEEWLPAGVILEIGPGFGRWTRYLQEQCDHLVLVDFNENCIEACRRRFAEKSNLSYHRNDGSSLAMVADASVDFVFSFDSLVHAPRAAIEAYLSQLGKKLKRDGVVFLHHSNLGSYAGSIGSLMPKAARRMLTKAGLAESNHSRASDMTADLFRDLCAQQRLKCIRQETINWRSRRLLDCISTFVQEGSKQDRPLRAWRNPDFMQEAELIRRRSQIYPAAGEGEAAQ